MKDKRNIEFSAAEQSALRGGVRLSADEYNNFSDIGDGGILTGAGDVSQGLRLRDDADGSRDGYEQIRCDVITRERSCSSACLRRDSDGGVRVQIKKSEGNTDI